AERGVSSLAGRRIGLLTASASRLGGGVFEAVATHAELLRALGAVPVVFALADAFAAEDRARFADGEVHHARSVGPAMVGYAPGLVATLLGARLDALHLHGIWMYPSRAAAQWARRAGPGRPYLISPHGMLDPWITGRGRAKKAVARLGYERASWAAAAAFHALTAAERSDIERETGRDEEAVVTIPNAVSDSSLPPRSRAGGSLLYIGRIHPKKNLAALVEAFARIAPRTPDARLEIAGWGAAEDVAALRAHIAALPASVQPGVRFHGPAYGADKEALLGSARAVVLPSLSEGLPMAILEAWAGGIPAVMTPACNLPEGFAAGAAIACGSSPEAIAAGLERMLGLDPAAWHAMSDAAHALHRERFSPAVVSAAWEQAYAWLIERAQALA
ncbi:MAG: glycosyltransferase, partial [Novosphingobium sp.]